MELQKYIDNNSNYIEQFKNNDLSIKKFKISNIG